MTQEQPGAVQSSRESLPARTVSALLSELPDAEPPSVADQSSTAPQHSPLPPKQNSEALPDVRLGIRVKLVTLMVLTSFLIVGVLASYFPARQISELRSGLRDRAATYGRLASLQLRPAIAFNDQQTAREVLEAIAKDPLIDGIGIYTEKGARLASVGSLSELGQLAKRGFPESRTFYLPGRVLVSAPVKSLEGPRGALVLELSTRSAVAARDRLIRVALSIGFGALMLGTLSAWGIARSLAGRVERIARAASAVSKGDLEQRLDLDGPSDEIGVLAHCFDGMVRRLHDLIQHIHEAAQKENERLELLVGERTCELDRRNADLHLVLDNVEQGFVTIDRDGKLVGERSRILELWLGPLSPGDSLWETLEASTTGRKASCDLAWLQVIEGVIPVEVGLAQMPHQLLIGERQLRLEYKPLGDPESFEKLLVIISDATAVIERTRMEQEEHDVLALSSRLLKDRTGLVEFFDETQRLLDRLIAGRGDEVSLKRDLHTLKGNTALFGMSHFSSLCHEAESELEETGCTEYGHLVAQWERTCCKLRPLLEVHKSNGLDVLESDYAAVVDAVRRGSPRNVLLRMLEAWRLEPLRARLERVGDQLLSTVQRLGKGSAQVVVSVPSVYLARDELSDFWSVFTHVIRNAASHGLETEEERAHTGKSGTARFDVRGGIAGDRLFVEIEDPGPGVDWDAVRARAALRGMPVATQDDLCRALFVDGLSTEDSAGDMCGRGVGLSAVRAVCERKHGRIDVATKAGQGTKFRFSWPTKEFKSLVYIDSAASHSGVSQ